MPTIRPIESHAADCPVVQREVTISRITFAVGTGSVVREDCSNSAQCKKTHGALELIPKCLLHKFEYPALPRLKAVWLAALIAGGAPAACLVLSMLFQGAGTTWGLKDSLFGLLLAGTVGTVIYVLVFFFGCLVLCPQVGRFIINDEFHEAGHIQRQTTEFRTTEHAVLDAYISRYVFARQFSGYVLALASVVLFFWLISRCSS